MTEGGVLVVFRCDPPVEVLCLRLEGPVGGEDGSATGGEESGEKLAQVEFATQALEVRLRRRQPGRFLVDFHNTRPEVREGHPYYVN